MVKREEEINDNFNESLLKSHVVTRLKMKEEKKLLFFSNKNKNYESRKLRAEM
jgi:hypothetical protein